MAETLKQKTVKGVLWNALSTFSTQGIQFVISIVLARLLNPSDYGVIGLTYVFLIICQVLVNSGFSNALIRKIDRTQEDLSTVFYYNIIASVIMYLILFGVAPYIALFYELPILVPLIRFIALSLIIGSFSQVQVAIYKIKLEFKSIAKVSISTSLVSGILGILLAFYGFGVWALAIQTVFSSFMSVIFYWLMSKWRPSFIFSWKSFHELFAYGSKLLLAQLLDTLYTNIYPIVIGKFYSPAQLGHYSRAQHYAQFPSSNLTGVIQNVTFPVLSELQNDDARLSSAYRRMLKLTAFIIFPLMLGLSAIAKPLVVLLIGEKWAFCAVLLQIMCFSMMWYPVHAINLNLLQVKGRSDLFLKLEVIKKFLGLCILFASIPLGLVGMCYFGILSSLICLFINTYYTGKLIGVGFRIQIADLIPILILALVMFGTIFIVIQFFNSIYIKLIFGTLSGAAIYFVGSYILKYNELYELIDIIKRKKYE